MRERSCFRHTGYSQRIAGPAGNPNNVLLQSKKLRGLVRPQ